MDLRGVPKIAMSAQHERLLVTAKEAAVLLAISERTLWQLTSDGDVPAIRLGRSVRYDLADLRAFIAAKRSGGAAERS